MKTLIPLLIASPYALTIWYWRDQNKRADIENARADLLQKDFHQIEKWATGTNEKLQLAAVHQLHPYARGDNGKIFQKPAAEIYKVLLSTWEEDTKEERAAALAQAMDELGLMPDDFGRIIPPPYIQAIHKITKADWNKFPHDFLPGINLSYADLLNAKFNGASLVGANLTGAYLTGIDLRGASLAQAELKGIDLVGARLNGVDFFDVNFYETDLRGADLEGAKLADAYLRKAQIKNTNFIGATYSKDTRFPKDFMPNEHEMVMI